MRIVVSDSSCLIDLRKASLLDAFLRLPYEILIPNTLFEDELLKFTPAQKRTLVDGGLKVVDVPGTGVLRVREIVREHPRLSIHDGFRLRRCRKSRRLHSRHRRQTPLPAREQHEIEVHGVLWIVDELRRHDVLEAEVLASALRLLEQDHAVRLPRRELVAAIRRYESAE